MAQRVLHKLAERFGEAILATHAQHGNETAVVDSARLLDIAAFLQGDPDLKFNLPVDCTVVDFWQKRTPRFEVVWHFYSLSHRHRIRIKVQVEEETPVVASLTPLWPGMNWHEREAWDLYGIRFRGHPNLKRVLMYEEFIGHPLRKDYPVDKRQPLISMRQVRDIPTQRHPPPEMLNHP